MSKRTIRALACLWLAAMPVMTLAQAPAPASASASAATARVERVYGTPVEFAREGDRFRRVGPLASGVRLEHASVIDSSAGGYVLVDAQPRPVWIDKLNLRLSGTVPKARCLDHAIVSSRSDSLTAGVRGAGENCP